MNNCEKCEKLKEMIQKAMIVMTEELNDAIKEYLACNRYLEAVRDDIDEALGERAREYHAGRMAAAAHARELLEKLLAEVQ